MVEITTLWLPILLSSVAVFFASFVLHMVLPLHRKDYGPVPGEDGVRAAMRQASIPPGNYSIPCPGSPKAMSAPETVAKYTEGPVALVTVFPNGPPAMGKSLLQWFVFTLVIGVFVAYLVGRTMDPGAGYRAVFRLAATVAFLGYVAAEPVNSIWRGQSWGNTFRAGVDGLVYALLTGGFFGWLWPDA